LQVFFKDRTLPPEVSREDRQIALQGSQGSLCLEKNARPKPQQVALRDAQRPLCLEKNARPKPQQVAQVQIQEKDLPQQIAEPLSIAQPLFVESLRRRRASHLKRAQFHRSFPIFRTAGLFLMRLRLCDFLPSPAARGVRMAVGAWFLSKGMTKASGAKRIARTPRRPSIFL
jgi:hypothetical protein